VSESEVAQSYPQVRTRYVRAAERAVPVEATGLPLVIEATSDRSMAFLCELLAQHAERIKRDIATHGALLVRGFEVANTAAFERAVLSITGMHGVEDVFNSEPGRDLVDGTRFVLHTNSLMKTGGTFAIGAFHNENFYLPDVPATSPSTARSALAGLRRARDKIADRAICCIRSGRVALFRLSACAATRCLMHAHGKLG
jgi:hypothetical protein